ncbi:MAG: ATP-binding protein [Myxococcota bacterium]
MALQRLFIDDSLRWFDLARAGDVIGVQTDGGGGVLLTNAGLFRVEQGTSGETQLRLQVPLDLGRSLHRDGDRWLVGAADQILAVEGERLRVVYAELGLFEDMASHPAHPELLFAGMNRQLVVLRRQHDGRFAAIQRVPTVVTVRDLTFTDGRTLWFRTGQRALKKLVKTSDGWELRTPELSEDFDSAQGYAQFFAGPGRLWANFGTAGLHRLDPQGDFVPDPRLASTLGLEFPEPVLGGRPDNPEVLVAEGPGPDRFDRLWLAHREPSDAPHEADWHEIPTWYFGDMQSFNICRGVIDGRIFVGGVGQVYAIDVARAFSPSPPSQPLIRVLRSWSGSSTVTRHLAFEGETLPWKDRGLEIRFASPEHHPRSRMSYRTRIPQLGETWSPWDDSTRRIFETLPAGSLSIQVQARDETGRQSDPRTVSIEVRPHPLLSPRAFLGYAGSSLALIALGAIVSTTLFRRRARRLQAELLARKTSEALARGHTRLLTDTMAGLSEQPTQATYLQGILHALKRELDARQVHLWLQTPDGTLEPDFALPDGAPWPSPLPAAEEREEENRLWIPLRFEGESLGLIGITLHRTRIDEPSKRLARALGTQATLAVRLSDLATDERERAVLAERASLAREVHDSLAQSFKGAGLQLEGMLFEAKPGGVLAPYSDRLELALELTRQGQEEARRCIQLLRGESPDGTALVGLLRTMESQAGRQGLELAFTVSGEPFDPPPRVTFEMFRIAQEAVNNAIAHAQSERAELHLEFGEEGQIQVVVLDHGVGFETESHRREGLGLRSMQERARLIGAALHLERASEGGTRVSVRWTC